MTDPAAPSPAAAPGVDPRRALDAIGTLPDAEIDLAASAIQLARIDASDADWRAAMACLSEIARDAAVLARTRLPPQADGPARASALADLLAGSWGFAGDTDSYDHPDNANLIRVLDRRRGLPVALGIVWLHAARAAGWPADGIDFPAHFLIALTAPAGPVVLDVFAGGAQLDAPALRAMLVRIQGPGAALHPDLLRPTGNRAILLRLANNLRTRRLAGGDLAGALACAEDMLRIAPDSAPLWRETGMLHQRIDQVGAALRCFERFLSLVPRGASADRLRAEMAALRARLH